MAFNRLFGAVKQPNDGKPRFIIVDKGTIRELNDEDSQRSRKRQRGDGEDDLECPKFPLRPIYGRNVIGPVVLINDPTYFYGEDPQADCYVRVENILFKIHGQLLCMSKLMSSRLANRTEPTSVKEPMELFGVSVDEFRALMWARYASEEDAKDQPRALEDLERLLHLATVTKNFEFLGLHEWSLQSLQQAFTSNYLLTDTCSSANYTRAIEIAAQYNATELLKEVGIKWTMRVQRRDIPAVPAILAADEHKLVYLRGIAYYTHLLEALEQAPPATPTAPLRLQADPKLSDRQLLRLLAGHLSLVEYTERLRRRPAKLERAPECKAEAHRACTLVWNERWHATAGSRKLMSLNSADILGVLAAMCELLMADTELVEGLTAPCRQAGLESLKRTLDEASTTLWAYFLGCL